MAEKLDQKIILIAEDEAPLRRILQDKLSQVGYTIVVAEDGEDAVTQFNEFNPDLVLLDLVMPKKDGFKVLEQIRIAQQDQTPVIVLSNLSQEDDTEASFNLGANDFMVKSNIDLTSLVTKISQLLRPLVSST
jgi:OmpR family response regulator RpaB